MLRIMGVVLVAMVAVQGPPPGPTGDMSGLVRIANGSALPGALVTAEMEKLSKVATTDIRGHYEFHHLPVGTYRVSVQAAGLEPSSRGGVTIKERSLVEIDFDLKIREQRFVDPVWTFVEPFVGSDAVDCGAHKQLATVAALKQSLECGLQATRDGKSFWTVREWTGIDSSLAHGLLGRRNGMIFVFDYDSAPCGGPSCVPKFSIERCPSPSVTGGGIEIRFSCNPGALGPGPGVYSLSTVSGSTRAARREGK